ncbi:MAG: serine/threonine protein kinase, partial [Myxococcales bacterium]|nr:serine/threonine protein kinase [Myxococcales bacterium]
MQPGDRIGPYRIEKRLGEGGIGEVFRAFDESLERNVAIKRLRPELAARETLVARFRLEAQTLARLNHPNIATLYALTHDAGSMYMVMEYVEGETVSALLRQRGPLALEPALRLAFQALSGIGYAHGRGVIHRDIKGANLMLDASGTLKIMDFGIARVLGGARHTRAGQMIGTPEFMAPEQIRGEDADERSDLYSLAILLYALLAGRAPFRARSEYQVMKAQVETPPPPLRDRMPELPRELDEVLRRALAKDADDRFQSAAEMRAALAPLGHDSWADGPLHWPTRPPGARERVLDADDALELEAPTEVAEGSPIASELPLIEAELIDAEPADEAPPTARPTLLPLERLARLGAFAGRPQLVLAGFALGALLGLDLVVVEPTGLAARAAAGAHSTAIRPLRTPL